MYLYKYMMLILPIIKLIFFINVVYGLSSSPTYSNCDEDGTCVIIPYNHIFNITSLAYSDTSPFNSSTLVDQKKSTASLVYTTQSSSALSTIVETTNDILTTAFVPNEKETKSDNTVKVIDYIGLEVNIISSSSNTSDTTAPQNSTNITLDDCHFLSFEEWKKLKKLESSIIPQQGKKEINESYSTINLHTNSTEEKSKSANLAPVIIQSDISKVESEEDQGRIYKTRFNYASSDCAATVVKTNSQAKGAAALLAENKDSYLLNKCSSPNKFVIIELCQDILIDSIVVGNYEFFSSMFKNIRVSVSDRFPSTNWKTLGEFEAENIRDIQTFNIENPMIWARYVKVEILTHYGNEYYCPISIIRVHGKTMMEEFKEDEQSKVVEVDDLINTNATEIESPLSDECRVVLPHLRLQEFLKDLNSTEREYCAATVPEVEATQSIETKSIQESIFKNIIKRLSLLESNATLSLLYIEEQSKLLSSAFTNLERRQTQNFDILIKSFNSSMNNSIKNFKNSYINLHQEYSKLFNSQEEKYGQVLSESSKRLIDITSELRFQKRVSIFNSIIIMCLLVYVVLTRGVYIESDETILSKYDSQKETNKIRSVKNRSKKHRSLQKRLR